MGSRLRRSGLRLRRMEAESGAPPLGVRGCRRRWRHAVLLLRLRPLPRSFWLLGVGGGTGCPSGAWVDG